MTALSLIGTPQSEPIWIQVGSVTGSRPNGGQYTELGLDGLPRPPQTFTAPSTIPRPNGGLYTELGLDGGFRAPETFLPKQGNRGIFGRTTVSVTPQATKVYGRRYTIVPHVTTTIRPIGAVITAAHTSNRQGRTTVSIDVRATLRYRRFGNSYSYQGGTTVTIGTFGAVRVRTRRYVSGSTTVSVTARAITKYTPAPVRNHHVSGQSVTHVTPLGTVSYAAGGLHYAFSGTNQVGFDVRGRVTIVRQTTHRLSGSVTITIRPQGTITKSSGPPRSYYILGGTTVALTPQARLGYNLGEVAQFAVSGHVTVALQPRGTVTVTRAPALTPLTTVRRGRRRFIRLFDYR